MADIIDRLAYATQDPNQRPVIIDILAEAMDEIAKLRKEIAEYKNKGVSHTADFLKEGD